MAQSMKERLDSYTPGARVKDSMKDTWEKQEDGFWDCVISKDNHIDEACKGLSSEDLITVWGPISRKLPETRIYFAPPGTKAPTVAELEAATEITEATVVDADYSWTGERVEAEVPLQEGEFVLPEKLTGQPEWMKGWEESWERFSDAWASIQNNPKKELLWRMNEWVSGRHPGQPVNWPGIERATARTMP